MYKATTMCISVVIGYILIQILISFHLKTWKQKSLKALDSVSKNGGSLCEGRISVDRILKLLDPSLSLFLSSTK